MRKVVLSSLIVSVTLAMGSAALAQPAPAPAPAPAPPMQYAPGLNLETAKKAAAAAAAEIKKNNWQMAIAVVSNGGHLVYFEKIDGTQFASIKIAQHKAVAAATFRRPTKAFEDRVAAGGAGLAVLTLDGVIASEGGIPLVVDGKIIGGIGCSGGTGQQDGVACQAGANALK